MNQKGQINHDTMLPNIEVYTQALQQREFTSEDYPA